MQNNENSSKTSNITASDEQKLFVCVFLRMCVGASKTIKKASNYLERKETSLFGRMSQVLEFSRETELIYNTYYKVIY